MKSVVYKSTADFLKYLNDRVEEKMKNSKDFLYKAKEKTLLVTNNILDPNMAQPNLAPIPIEVETNYNRVTRRSNYR